MAKINAGYNSAILTLLACCIFVLAGCTAIKRPNTTESKSQWSEKINAQANKEADQLAQCQKELEALKSINLEQHNTFLQEFKGLMSEAAKYSSLRPKIKEESQETIDALYRYKVNRLCANISQATLTGLAERGENLK